MKIIHSVLLSVAACLTACGGSSSGGASSSVSSSSSSSSVSSSSSSSGVAADLKVVGYIPSYKGLVATVDATDLSLITHINIAFINPNDSGVLVAGDTMTCMADGLNNPVPGSAVRYVVQEAHEAGVKVLASVAGGVLPACSGDWAALLTPENRDALVENLVQLVDDFELDGLDIDIEGVLLTNIDNAGNYTPFIQELSEAMRARDKLLTAATASYVGGMVPVSSLEYFDYVTIMSYDAIGPTWSTPGIVEHSTYAHAESHIQIWQNRGLTKDQLVLGVPFYGYGFGTYAGSYGVSDILSQFGEAQADVDLVGTACSGCNYITYNGLPTIRAKTELALAEGSGVMIWELSHDASGAYSLLNAINEVMAAQGQ